MPRHNKLLNKRNERYSNKKTMFYTEEMKAMNHLSKNGLRKAANWHFENNSQKLVGLLLFSVAAFAAMPPETDTPQFSNNEDTVDTVTTQQESILLATKTAYDIQVMIPPAQNNFPQSVKTIFSETTPTLFRHHESKTANYTSVDSFIQSQKIIRIMAVAVGNYGHLAATHTLMNNLRMKLQFNGTFEVVYPRMDVYKMSVIFGFPNTVEDIYEDEKNKIKFITLEKHREKLKNKQVKPAILGMSACADDAESVCTWISHLVTLSSDDTDICRNVAKLLNVDVYASLTHDPHHKHYQGTMFQRGDQIFLTDDDKSYLVTKPDTFFTTPAITFEQAKHAIFNDPGIMVKKPAIMELINGIEEENFNLLPIYGRTINEFYRGNNDALANILQIITGARHAQIQINNQSTTSPPLPLIIAVFHDYKEKNKIIDDFIFHPKTEQQEEWVNNIRKAITDMGIDQPEIFLTADIGDESTQHTIRILKPNQVLLLSMGSFPKKIFDGLYTYTNNNIWPQIREGYSSLSSLYLTHKPHFRCGNFQMGSNWDVGFDYLADDPALELRMKQFYQTTDGFCCGTKTWQHRPELYKELSQFIQEATSTDSAFSQYFKRLGEAASSPTKDRIIDVLETVVKYVNGDKSAVGTHTLKLPTW